MDRVKDALGSSHPGNQPHDPDYRPPGSFPTDDMAPSDSDAINSANNSSSHTRNKLHKSNDPRGNHGQTDAGVGLHSSNKPAVTNERVEEAYAPAEGYDQRREHAKRSGAAEFDDVKADQRDTTEYNADPNDLGATAGTAAGARVNPIGDDETSSHNVVRTGKQKSNVDHADPYWGDLPQGKGVYNTVAGHGSSSDEARRQHDDVSDQRSFPLVTDRTRAHHDTTNTTTTDTHDSQRTQEKDSHWKEGAAGGALAGAAGTAAYKAHSDDKDRSRETYPEETAEEKEKKGRGGLFGVFHRGSKDEKDNDHHRDEKKLHKEEKHHHDKSAPVAAAGYASRDDRRQDEQRYQDQTATGNTRSTTTDPAVAAAAVAYSQHNDNRTSSSNQNPPATQGNKGDYNTLGSGTASGVRYGDEGISSSRDPTTSSRDIDSNKDSNRNAMYGTAGAAAALGAGGYAAHELRKDRDDRNDPLNRDNTRDRDENTSRSGTGGGWFTSPQTNTTTTTTTTTSQYADPAQSQRDTYAGDDNRRTGGFIAAPVPDLHSSDRQVVDDTTSSRDNKFSSRGNAYSHDDTSTRDNYSSSTGIATGAGAGAAAAAAATTIGRTGNNDTSSQPKMREPSSEIPRATEEANQGKYNLLSSGTPSGINTH